MSASAPIILASSSVYRQQILNRLGLQFCCHSPDIDETPLDSEHPEALVRRLSESKAREVAASLTEGLVIGSDQVAELNGRIQGKPRDHAEAVAQLKAASAATAILYCGVSVINAATGSIQTAVEQVEVTYRHLGSDEIERYLAADEPYHCCGSLKVESLGISLLSQIRSNDPNTITGLPVIKLLEMLRNEGVIIP